MIKKYVFLIVLIFSSASCWAESIYDWCYKEASKIAKKQNITPDAKIKEWQKYEKKCYESGAYHQWLADFYISYDYFEEALELLERAIKHEKYDTRKHKIHLSAVYFYFDRIDDSEKLAVDLLKNYPNWYGGYYLKGLVYMHLKKWLDAERFLEKSLQINNKHIQTLICLSEVSYELGKYDDVIKYYDAAYMVDKRLPFFCYRASLYTAMVCISKGDFKKAKCILDTQKKFDKDIIKQPGYQQVIAYYERELAKANNLIAEETLVNNNLDQSASKAGKK